MSETDTVETSDEGMSVAQMAAMFDEQDRAAAEAAEAPEEDAATTEDTEAAGAEESDAEQETPDGSQADQDGEGEPEEANAQAEEDDEPETPAIEAPQFWPAELRAQWEKVPPELQSGLIEREKSLSTEVSVAKQRAAEAERAVEQKLVERFEETVRDAELVHEDRFANVTDEQILQALDAGELTPDQAKDIRHARDESAANLRKLRETHAETAAKVRTEAIRKATADLQQRRPEWADVSQLPKLREDVIRAGQQYGLKPEEILPAQEDARMMEMLQDLSKYHALKAEAEAAKTRKPNPKPAPKQVLKPAKSASSTQNPRLAALQKKAKSPVGLTQNELAEFMDMGGSF